MNDTIAGISTTLGVGAISIVRVSGKESIKIVNSIFKGKNLEKVDTHTINYGYIVDKDEVIDEVLVSIMKAPRTFTREDVVEINCHGGIATTNKILELLLLNGARLAEAGEFTKRAFLNGRIDLVEAESIMDIINAKTDKARKLSINQLEGRVSNIIRSFRQELLELLASIEVNIDYPEYEDIAVMTVENIKDEMKNIREKLEKIVNESENGKIIRDGIKTVIVGRPNVGKSSILNKLLDYDKAIVTDIAGTTRDIVEGEINLDGILLKLVDTAGIRETDDIVEKIGVNRSLEELENADLIIVVLNNNEELSDYDKELLDKVKNRNSIVVINKCDLERKLDINLIDNDNIIEINTVEFDKIDVLKDKIKELFNLDRIEQSDYNYLSNIRQITLAKECLTILKEVEEAVKREDPVDLIEIDIKRIWTKLGEIIGDTYSDELIDQLFSQFCLGK
ncbi:MAG: tRNA uridine-5-carboxymethylaminomethyl(34) synthesis GTPase MnmE [Firmicutes bacterium]|nr:tRNA uridine-5-carboxymethylaminomethyl(34) synthesis GTPase MnmE [Bacillota bacterium]